VINAFTVMNLENGLMYEFSSLPDAYAYATRQSLGGQVVLYSGPSAAVYPWLTSGILSRGEQAPHVIWSSLQDSDQTMNSLLGRRKPSQWEQP
jgi:hypothetical protein